MLSFTLCDTLITINGSSMPSIFSLPPKTFTLNVVIIPIMFAYPSGID